jgi:hypothetical protein
MRLTGSFTLASFVVLVLGLAARGAETARFRSPGGRYEVTFEELQHVRYPLAESAESIDRISHVRYRVIFFAVGASQPRASVEFADVYGWSADARPAEPAELFKAVSWSPGEHFAVLDEEDWARAPGAPERRAVALDPTLPWESEPFRLHELLWVDELRAAGNVHDDCSYAVALFDGRAGQTRRLFTPASPLGYEVVRVEGRQLHVRTLLDNCRTEDDALAFVANCFVMDLDSMQHERVECLEEPRRKAGLHGTTSASPHD